MNKIDKLIEELCPEGVPWLLLEDLGTIYTGLSGKSKEDFSLGNAPYVSYLNIGNHPALPEKIDARVQVRYGEKQNFIQKGDLLFTGSSEDLEGVGLTSEVQHTPKELTYLNSFCFGWRPVDGKFHSGFLKHLFRSEQLRAKIKSCSNGVTRINISKKLLLKIAVPIPPLAVQVEIVSILDKFTQLEAELEAELEAREKQYQSIVALTISKHQGANSLEFKLAELAEIYDGTHQTPNYVTNGVRFVSVENIDFLEGSNKYVSLEAYESDYKVKPVSGDLFMTRIGSVGRATVVKSNEPLAYYVSLALIRLDSSRLDSNFLKHWLSSPSGKSELAKWTLWSATPIKINLGDIGRLRLTVPGIEAQREIGSRLDYLESLLRGSSIGLPAEITARRQQYEYYRNKLLTFTELKAS
jgi:type I restriction enzyme S subunit